MRALRLVLFILYCTLGKVSVDVLYIELACENIRRHCLRFSAMEYLNVPEDPGHYRQMSLRL